MPYQFSVPGNNISTVIGPGGYTAGSGRLTLTYLGGSFFSANPFLGSPPPAGYFYRVTVTQARYAGVANPPTSAYTVYKATGVTGDTLTIAGAIENTTDRSYAAGDLVEVRMTAGTLVDIYSQINWIEGGNAPLVVGTTPIVGGGTAQVLAVGPTGILSTVPQLDIGVTPITSGTTGQSLVVGAGGVLQQADQLSVGTMLGHPATPIVGGTVGQLLVVAAGGVLGETPTTGITAVGTITTGTWNATPIDILHGGTGATSASGAYNALSPMSTTGDIEYEAAPGVAARLAGPTAATKQFLTSTGTGTVAQAPSWGPVTSGDLPTITLTGPVTGSASGGTVSTAIGNGAVTNAMLAGSITASKLVGTDIAAVGTITTGTWDATPVAILYGGTGATSASAAYNALSPMSTTGDIEYEAAPGVAARLPGPTAATKKFLTSTGTGTAAQAPAWGPIAAGDLAAAGASGNVLAIGSTGALLWESPPASLAIGTAVGSGHANRVLYEDGSGNLADAPGMTFDGTTLYLSAVPSLPQQGPNLFFAGPTSATGPATFRKVVPADMPILAPSGATHAAGAAPDPGATAGTTRYLREDATWAVPPGGGGGSSLAIGATVTGGTAGRILYEGATALLADSANLTVYGPTSSVTNLNLGLNVGATPTYGIHAKGGAARVQGLATPVISAITPTGTGTQTYSYQVVALDVNGNRSLASGATSITNATTLNNSTNYNQISWSSVPNAASYDILLTPLATPSAPIITQGGGGLPANTGGSGGNPGNSPSGANIFSYVPALASNTGQLPLVASASSDASTFTTNSSGTTTGTTTFQAYQAFDGKTGTFWQAAAGSTTPWWLQIDLGPNNGVVCVQYAVTGAPTVTQSPQAWTFQGSNDGSSFTTLDTQSISRAWGASERMVFSVASPAYYRYYRLNITAIMSGTTLSVTQLDIGTGGTLTPILTTLVPNLASNSGISGYVPLASTELDSSHQAWQAFDGVTATLWEATGATGTLQIDLGSGNGQVAYQYGILGSSTANQSPKSWTFNGSNDGSTWTPLDTRTNTTFTASQLQNFSISNTASYRYYQLNVSANGGGSNLALSQLNILSPAIASTIVPYIGADAGFSGYVPSASTEAVGGSAFQAFDNSPSTMWTATTTTGTLTIYLGAANFNSSSGQGKIMVTQYSITASSTPNQTPTSWTFEGSQNNSSWSTLDTQSGVASWNASERRTFCVTQNNTSVSGYAYYRLHVTVAVGGSALAIAGLDIVSGDIKFTSTRFGYWVSAVDANGFQTAPSVGGWTQTSPTSLTPANYNAISWTAVPGAVGYNVLRGTLNSSVATNIATTSYNDVGASTSGFNAKTGTPWKIGNTTSTSYTDQAGSATAGAAAYTMPVVNHTADVTSDGTFFGDSSNATFIPTIWDASNGLLSRPSSITQYINPSTGWNSGSIGARMGQVFNVRDWGVKGDAVGPDDAAINALLLFLAQRHNVDGSGVCNSIYFPSGTYVINNPIVFAKRIAGFNPGTPWNGLHIYGDGNQTTITNGATVTELFRFEDCSNLLVENMALKCSAKPDSTALRVTTAALHVTAVQSGEFAVFNNLYVDCGNICPVGYGVALDYPNDTSQIKFYNCFVQNSSSSKSASDSGGPVTDPPGWFVVPNMFSQGLSTPPANSVQGHAGAGFKIGSGYTGNVLDVTMFSCRVASCNMGVWINGGPVAWYGGNFEHITIADVFLSQGVSGPCSFDGYRSEFPNKMFWGAGGGTMPPINFSNIDCDAWFGWTYKYDGVSLFTQNVLERFVTNNTFSGQVALRNVAFRNATQISGNSPGAFAAPRYSLLGAPTNLVFDTCVSKWENATSMKGDISPGGGLNTGINAVVIPGPVHGSSDNYLYDNQLGLCCDYNSCFGGRMAVGIENYGAPDGFNQRGGSMRIQKLDDPFVPPILAKGGTATGATYTYSYVLVDNAGNRTKPSPTANITNATSLNATNFNTITIPHIRGTAYVEFLLSVNSGATNVLSPMAAVNPTPPAASFWNPWFSNSIGATSFSGTGLYTDQSGATASYVTPTRNATGDLTVDGQMTVGQNLGLNQTAPTYGLHQVGGGQRLQAVATPSAPTVVVNTGSGTSTYYYVAAQDQAGNWTLPSTPTNVSGGSSQNNTIVWTPATGAVNYAVLRSASSTLSPGSQSVLVGTIIPNQYSCTDTISGTLPSFTLGPAMASGAVTMALSTVSAPGVASNSVSPSGATYYYYIVAQDKYGFQTAVSSASAGITSNTTPNNTITWYPVIGAVKYYILRYTSATNPFGTNSSPVAQNALVGVWPSGSPTYQISINDVAASLTSFTVPSRNVTADSTIDGNLILSGTGAQQGQLQLGGAATFSSGSGTPTIAGATGDYFFRTDTPGTTGQRIYVCTVAGAAGASTWLGIV